MGFAGQRASSGLSSSHASCGCIGLPRAACCRLSLWWVGRRRTRMRPQIPLKMKEATWQLCCGAPDPSMLTGSPGSRICRIQAGQHVLFFLLLFWTHPSPVPCPFPVPCQGLLTPVCPAPLHYMSGYFLHTWPAWCGAGVCTINPLSWGAKWPLAEIPGTLPSLSAQT